MSIAQQRRIVAVSSIVVFSLGIFHRFSQGESFTDPTAARFFIGVGLAFTMVSIATDLGSEIGAAFALLIMLAAFIYEGMDAFNFISLRGGLQRGASKSNKSVRKTLRKEGKPFTKQNVFPNFAQPTGG